MLTHRNHISSFAFIAGLAAVACAGDGEKQKVDPTNSSSTELMALAGTCEDVNANLQAQFRAELAKTFTIGSCGVYSTYANGTRENVGVSMGGSVAMTPGTMASGTNTATAIDTSTGAGGSASGGGDTPTEGKATVVTQTNVQVNGVDEGDIVKTDGKNLYVLHDQALELVAASTTGKLKSSAGIALEGVPRELYVIGGASDATRKLVVIADVYGPDVYAKAQVAVPGNTPGYANAGTSGGAVGVVGPTASAGMMGKGGSSSFDVAPSTTAGATGGVVTATTASVAVAPAPEGPAAGVTANYPYGALPMTKVTILEGTDSSLTVKNQTYYDGYYKSSRRQGEQLHIVFGIDKQWPLLNSCPTESERMKAEMVVLEEVMDSGRSVADVPAEELGVRVGNALVDTVLEQNPDMMDTLVAANYLPRSFVLEGDSLTERSLACNQIYLPRAGSSVSGVTYVENIDLTAPSKEGGGRAILGQASLMYENQEALILGVNTSEWSEDALTWGETAYVHRFNVGTDGLSYQTSGVAAGRIKDQFSFDVVGEDLRLVLSEGWRTEQRNRLDILRTDPKTKLLTSVGSVSGIGDGEDVKAVRFIGDTAYVVTFVQTDPLYAIDVSNGAAPKILGALADIPGFSTYLHPMDANHLLTVGQDTSTWTPMVQIFDVTAPGSPVLLHKLAIPTYGNSVALTEYKAFTYYPEQGLLAIPFAQYSGSPMNAMQLFDVSVTDGVSLVGQVDGDFILGLPEGANNGSCYYYGYSSGNQEMFSRSVFFDDILFAVAQHGIASVSIDAPEVPLDRLVFNASTQTSNYYCDPYLSTGGATSVGATSVGGAPSFGTSTTFSVGGAVATAGTTSVTVAAGGTTSAN